MAKCNRIWRIVNGEAAARLQLCLLFDLKPLESGCLSVRLSTSAYTYTLFLFCNFFSLFQQFMLLSSRFYGSGLLLCLRFCCFTALYSHITEHHQQQQQQHTPNLTHTRAVWITLFIVIGSDAHFSNKNQKVQNKIHEKALTRTAYT